ncbi:hypothetical protein BKP37_02495 [Anaerobacillus alkalilacustris]|uniref:Uncharacterized protein n=1 Tax=Anaerobacillus alkalilacustris TaxID=393763 RepID=A0A1S2LYV8_9BACI|nr:hypothetical protein BKP37_02495 [Anaerobacillus alkalilacustris]
MELILHLNFQCSGEAWGRTCCFFRFAKRRKRKNRIMDLLIILMFGEGDNLIDKLERGEI